MRRLVSMLAAMLFTTGLLGASPGSSPSVAASDNAPIPIATYDVVLAPLSGWECWTHDYAGDFWESDMTVSGGSCGTGRIGAELYGHGALTDGVISSSIEGTQLFYLGATDQGDTALDPYQGVRVDPFINIAFRSFVRVHRILIYGGDVEGSAIPGSLTGVTVELGYDTRFSADMATVPFGDPNANDVPRNDLIDLEGTPLADVWTGWILLGDNNIAGHDGFTANGDRFSITEIRIEGEGPIPVGIDVQPGDRSNVIKEGGRQTIPVAILGSPSFNVADIDQNPNFLRFGADNPYGMPFDCKPPADVNKDRIPDLLCQYVAYSTDLAVGDTRAYLSGRLLDGRSFLGSDAIVVKR